MLRTWTFQTVEQILFDNVFVIDRIVCGHINHQRRNGHDDKERDERETNHRHPVFTEAPPGLLPQRSLLFLVCCQAVFQFVLFVHMAHRPFL